MNTEITCHKKNLVVVVIVATLIITLQPSKQFIQQSKAQTTYEVKISDFAFVPQNLTINLGDTIVWNNTDPVVHTLWFVYVANGSTYLLSDPISPGATWNYTFIESVELQYYSLDKLWITGFINVGEAAPHDIATVNVSTSKDGGIPAPTLCQAFTATINVTILNEGNFTENVTVTAYANTTVIGTQTYNNLPPSAQTTLTFIWNASGWSKGNYTIWAYANPVPEETDTVDNTFVGGIVTVTIPGDVDGDFDVDILDVVKITGIYGSKRGDPGFNPNSDIDDDGKITILDVVICTSHYGQTDP